MHRVFFLPSILLVSCAYAFRNIFCFVHGRATNRKGENKYMIKKLADLHTSSLLNITQPFSALWNEHALHVILVQLAVRFGYTADAGGGGVDN